MENCLVTTLLSGCSNKWIPKHGFLRISPIEGISAAKNVSFWKNAAGTIPVTVYGDNIVSATGGLTNLQNTTYDQACDNAAGTGSGGVMTFTGGTTNGGYAEFDISDAASPTYNLRFIPQGCHFDKSLKTLIDFSPYMVKNIFQNLYVTFDGDAENNKLSHYIDAMLDNPTYLSSIEVLVIAGSNILNDITETDLASFTSLTRLNLISLASPTWNPDLDALANAQKANRVDGSTLRVSTSSGVKIITFNSSLPNGYSITNA